MVPAAKVPPDKVKPEDKLTLVALKQVIPYAGVVPLEVTGIDVLEVTVATVTVLLTVQSVAGLGPGMVPRGSLTAPTFGDIGVGMSLMT